jgi:hypothetical protein
MEQEPKELVAREGDTYQVIPQTRRISRARVFGGAGTLAVVSGVLNLVGQLPPLIQTGARIVLAVALAFLIFYSWQTIRTLYPRKRILVNVACGTAAVLLVVIVVYVWNYKEPTSATTISIDAELFSAQLKELQRATDILGGKDEIGLREVFDFPMFTRLNLKFAREVVAPGTLTPAELDEISRYFEGGTRLVSFKYARTTRLSGGGLKTEPIPDRVGLVLVSKKYRDAKALLMPFESSPLVPRAVRDSIKAFDKAVDDDLELLLNVINERLIEDKNNILLENDMNSPYFGGTNNSYVKRFTHLKPKADDVLEKIRAFLKVQ